MPRYEKNGHVVETTNAREGVRLKASGYREQKALTQDVRKGDAEKK